VSQPTGEHASGVELASGYVKVEVQTGEGTKKLHAELDAIETHGAVVGKNTGQSIVTAVAAAGEPAAKGFSEKLRADTSGTAAAATEHAGTFRSTFMEAIRSSTAGENFAYLFRGAGEVAEQYGGVTAERFSGRFVQLLAANRIDAERESAKTGEALAQGVRRGAEAGGESFGLGESFKTATEHLKTLGAEGGEAGEKVAGIGGALLGLASNPVVLVTGAVLGLVGALGEVTDKLFDLGEKWEETFHRIEIQTGATGERLGVLEEDTKRLVGRVPLATGQIGSIVAGVATSLKDTGVEVTEVAKVVGDLQSMVGPIDLTGLGKGIRVAGLGGDAQAQIDVLNQLFKASQQTQIPINTLIDSLARAAPVAKTLGISLGETTSIMSQLGAAGIDPGKTLMILSRAAADATKNHHSLATELSTTIEKIRNASTEEEKLKIASDAFGKGRGLAASIVAGVDQGLTLDPATLDRLEHMGSVIEDTRKETLSWGDQWTMFKGQVEVALEPLSGVVFKNIVGGLSTAVSWMEDHKQQIVTFFEVLTKASVVVVEVLAKVGGAIVIVAGIVQSQFGNMVKWIGDAMADIGGALGHLPEWLGGGAWTHSLENAGHDAQRLGDKMNAAGQVITNWGINIENVSGQIVPKAFAAINAAVEGTKTAADGASDSLKKIPGAMTLLSSMPPPKPINIPVNAVPGQGVTLSPDQKSIQVLMSIVTGQPVPPGGPTPGTPGYNPLTGPFGGASGQWPQGVPRQRGGGISGFGGGDVVPALLEPGEHVSTKEEVAGVGGHGNMQVVRALMRHGILSEILAAMGFAAGGSVHLAGHAEAEKGWVLERFKAAGIKPAHFQGGGEVAAVQVLQAESGRTPYVLGGFSPDGIDCSGLVSEVVNAFLGMPAYSTGDRMATGSEAAWLTKKGFLAGVGPPGTLRVGFYNGGPAGGHTALTLPSGINAESGGSGGGVRLGGGAAGANDPEFTQHYYLPARGVVEPGGYGGTGSGGSGGYGGAGGAGGASPEQVAAADTAVSAAQGSLDVAGQRVTEAQQALDVATNKPVGKGPKGQEAHDRAVAEAQSRLRKVEAERDQKQSDLDSRQSERAGLTGDTDPKALVAAKDRVTEANQRLSDAQAKLDRDRADPKVKPSQIMADENAVAEAKERVAKAEQHVQEVESRPGKGEKGGKGKDADLVSAVGDALGKGLQENIPPGFSNPLSWGGVKSAAALLKFLGGVAGAHGSPGAAAGLNIFGDVLGGSGGSVAKDVMALMSPQAYAASGGGLPTSNPALPPDMKSAGAGNTNTTVVNRPQNYYGDIHDDGRHQQAVDAAAHRDVKKTLQRWVMT
jgi:hypothetical protein